MSIFQKIMEAAEEKQEIIVAEAPTIETVHDSQLYEVTYYPFADSVEIESWENGDPVETFLSGDEGAVFLALLRKAPRNKRDGLCKWALTNPIDNNPEEEIQESMDEAKSSKSEEVYADFDEDTEMYCVFGVDSGKAYASFASKEEAEAEAKKMNKSFKSKTCESSEEADKSLYEAKEKSEIVYVDYDDRTKMYVVYGSSSGKTYSSFSTEEEAFKDANDKNKSFVKNKKRRKSTSESSVSETKKPDIEQEFKDLVAADSIPNYILVQGKKHVQSFHELKDMPDFKKFGNPVGKDGKFVVLAVVGEKIFVASTSEVSPKMLAS